VETSAFNAEAPTEPAGETVGCRRQLGGIVRLILYDFVKIPQSFFCFQKNDGSLSLPTFADCEQPQGLSLRLSSNENAHRIKPSSDEEGGTPQA